MNERMQKVYDLLKDHYTFTIEQLDSGPFVQAKWIGQYAASCRLTFTNDNMILNFTPPTYSSKQKPSMSYGRFIHVYNDYALDDITIFTIRYALDKAMESMVKDYDKHIDCLARR